MIEIKIGENESNQRLDKFLRKFMPKASLSYIYKLIRKKDIKINGKRTNNNVILEKDDNLEIYISDEELEKLTEQKKVIKVQRQFEIAYEDENLLVVEKPKGLLVHGDKNEKKNTLINQVHTYLQQKGEYMPNKENTFSPAAVNRIDRNTSGLVMFGKNNKTVQLLNKMIKDRKYIRKYYIVMVYGKVKSNMLVKGNLVKNEEKNKVSMVKKSEEKSYETETIFRPLKSNGTYTLLEAELITGRTHQIRAHLKEKGYPLLGDDKYGNMEVNKLMKKKYGLNSQFLHAYKLVFEESLEHLDYLRGKEINSRLPLALENIEKDIFRIGDKK